MKIVIVPHTHWDREWYFTNSVSDSLLKFNLNNMLDLEEDPQKYYLDGQVSLLEDYISSATESNQKKIKQLIKDKKIIVGPFYSQPDVFNSLGETTIRNIEIAEDYLNKNGLPNSPIFYCPDTFGFGFNIPQIINHLNFKYFVFWRGLGHEHTNNDFYNWSGPNNSKIKSYRLKFGYWTFSSIFPWLTLNENNLFEEVKKCLNTFKSGKQFLHYSKQAEKNNGLIIIPFGGDQAPYHPLTNKFIAKLNEIDDNEWLIGDYTQLLDNYDPDEEIEGTIDCGYESKIHRTISSTRYDFKKLFRENEINLYHQLEPLELFYKYFDKSYQSENSNIYKHLIHMQAHDILGGCVTDNAYLSSMQKLKDVHDEINAKKNIILKQISTELKLIENQILIFNPNTNNNAKNWFVQDIYTSDEINDFYEDDKVLIYKILSYKNSQADNSYKTQLLVINKNLTPFSYHVIDLNKTIKTDLETSENCNLQSLLNFKITRDNGDLFDADPMSLEIETNIIVNQSQTIIMDENISITNLTGSIIIDGIENNFKIRLMKIFNENDLEIIINNNTPNVIVKWTPDIEFNELYFSQHLGVGKYKDRSIENWKELGYLEYPMNVEKQSGIIFNDDNYICTKGTNEFTMKNGIIDITLYRSTGVLGKANLSVRPGSASGIDGYHIDTPLGQLLNQDLVFNFRFGKLNANSHDYLNAWFKTLICFQPYSKDVISNGIERFIFTSKNIHFGKSPSLKFPIGFISCLKLENDKIITRVVDFNHNSKEFNIIKKGEQKYG
ncbi:MAG: hypothetical protein ACRC4L_01205 [Mycoplasma sp.]